MKTNAKVLFGCKDQIWCLMFFLLSQKCSSQLKLENNASYLWICILILDCITTTGTLFSLYV